MFHNLGYFSCDLTQDEFGPSNCIMWPSCNAAELIAAFAAHFTSLLHLHLRESLQEQATPPHGQCWMCGSRPKLPFFPVRAKSHLTQRTSLHSITFVQLTRRGHTFCLVVHSILAPTMCLTDSRHPFLEVLRDELYATVNTLITRGRFNRPVPLRSLLSRLVAICEASQAAIRNRSNEIHASQQELYRHCSMNWSPPSPPSPSPCASRTLLFAPPLCQLGWPLIRAFHKSQVPPSLLNNASQPTLIFLVPILSASSSLVQGTAPLFSLRLPATQPPTSPSHNSREVSRGSRNARFVY